MGSFGERLQREREMRGIGLEEIAESTKISARSLRAIELEEFHQLPGGIFNKGFVRAYAKYLGIDEDQAVADFLAAEASQAKPVDEEAVIPNPPTTERSAWTWLAPVLALLVLAAGLFGWRQYEQRALSAAPEPQVTQPAQPAVQPASHVADTQPDLIPPDADEPELPPATENAAAEMAATPAGKFTVEIRARDRVWVAITADGKLVVEETLSPGISKSVTASKEVQLKTGNAGGLDIAHNGTTLEPLGDSKQVRTVTLGPQGIRQ